MEDAISIPSRDGSRQRKKSFSRGIEQGTVSFSNEQFARLKRFVEKRDRDTAHVTVAPVDTAQHRSPRSSAPEISSDVCVCMEKRNEDIEKRDESRMNPEPAELESPSAGTGLETSVQQCPPNGEIERTTADDYLLVGVGSNLGGTTFSPAEIATPPAASNTIFLKASSKLEDREKVSEENKQFDPGGKGEKPPP